MAGRMAGPLRSGSAASGSVGGGNSLPAGGVAGVRATTEATLARSSKRRATDHLEILPLNALYNLSDQGAFQILDETPDAQEIRAFRGQLTPAGRSIGPLASMPCSGAYRPNSTSTLVLPAPCSLSKYRTEFGSSVAAAGHWICDRNADPVRRLGGREPWEAVEDKDGDVQRVRRINERRG